MSSQNEKTIPRITHPALRLDLNIRSPMTTSSPRVVSLSECLLTGPRHPTNSRGDQSQKESNSLNRGSGTLNVHDKAPKLQDLAPPRRLSGGLLFVLLFLIPEWSRHAPKLFPECLGPLRSQSCLPSQLLAFGGGEHHDRLCLRFSPLGRMMRTIRGMIALLFCSGLWFSFRCPSLVGRLGAPPVRQAQ